MPITTRKNIAVRDLPRSPKPGAYVNESGVGLMEVIKKQVQAVLIFADDVHETVRLDAVHAWDVTEPTTEEASDARFKSVLDYIIDRRGDRAAAIEQVQAIVRDMGETVANNHPVNVSYSDVERLIAARAAATVAARIEYIVQGEHYTGLATSAEKVKLLQYIVTDQVAGWWGARSTSKVSNLMDEVEHDMWVAMLRDLRDREM